MAAILADAEITTVSSGETIAVSGLSSYCSSAAATTAVDVAMVSLAAITVVTTTAAVIG